MSSTARWFHVPAVSTATGTNIMAVGQFAVFGLLGAYYDRSFNPLTVYLICTGAAMTKSQSMPCHVTALPPDPFPELSQHKMPLYRFHDGDRAGERSLTSEMGRTSPSPSPMSGTVSTDVSASETSSATDAVSQVVA